MIDTPPAPDAIKIDEVRWNLIKKKANEERASKAFSLFRAHGIEPILIKGLAAARYYPDSIFRDSIDMDLALASVDFEAAKRIIRSDEAKRLGIDLHRELRHLDTMSWSELFDSSKLLQFETGTIRVLREEDHLRVQCVHWLTDGGSNKDRLWDIYYQVDKRGPNFDWDRFLNSVSGIRRRWFICTLGLAHMFLGLDLSRTPIENDARDLPKWLTTTVEKEWTSDVPFRPLYDSLHDRKLFVGQLLKRMPPNPICATILMEGSFDARTRIFYQIGTVLRRIGPSIVNLAKTLSGRFM